MPLSKFKAYHYVYIAVIRNISHTELTTLSKLKTRLDPLTSYEISVLEYWSSLAHAQDDLYPQYTASQLAVFLSIKTGYHCPLDPISLYFKNSDGRKHLLAWYLLYQQPIDFPPFTATPEQHLLLDTSTGLHIINAGPGTGKTTTAVQCAIQWQDTGVIMISYSNEAVKEIYHKFAEYPLPRGTVAYKIFGQAPIVVATIDSLAWHILQKPSDIDQTYDQYIDQADTALQNGYLGIFNKYHTILVDESQDIDERRGNLILNLYARNLITRMLIFGDPRQRLNHKSGAWYTSLWQTLKLTRQGFKAFTNELVEKEYTAQKHVLSLSHRFRNQQILDYVNEISAVRESLHVSLSGKNLAADSNKIIHYSLGSHEESGLQGFATYLKSLHIPWSEMVIVIPSMHRNNVTSSKCAQLCAILQDSGISCYTRKEGSYLPQAILISTIHAVKGKEFRVVILYRMNGFPAGFFPIPYEDAVSQIYVANTRAKEHLIYLSTGSFTPPATVPLSYITGHQSTLSVQPLPAMPRPEARIFAVTEVLTCHGWSRLANINGYSLQTEDLESGPSVINPGIEPRLWGILCSVVLQSILSGKVLQVITDLLAQHYISLSVEEYAKAARKGQVLNGRWMIPGKYLHYWVISENNINNLRMTELHQLQQLLDKRITDWQWQEWALCTQVVDYFIGNHMLSRYTLQIPTSAFPWLEFQKVAQYLTAKYGRLVKYESSCQFGWIAGACDLVFENDVILEIKSCKQITNNHRQQVFLYRILSQATRADIYNISTGDCETITSLQSDMRWRYLLDCYGTIRNHIDIVTDRANRLQMQGKKLPSNKQLFFADTEFTCINNTNYEIFDFSLLNVADPYASIISTYRTSSSFAVEWLTSHNEQWQSDQIINLLVTSPLSNSEAVVESFAHMPNYPMYYYVAPADAIIPRRFGLECRDLRKAMVALAKTKGVSYQSSVNIKLGEIYDVVCLPMEWQKHLHQHWALTDTLLLYELYILGYLVL